MAAVGEAPTLFLRKATGLVKGWSKFDAFLYSFMSVNFVTLGLFFALSVLAFVPTGQVLPAIIISGIFVTFLVITYAGFISVMPRAGGALVWLAMEGYAKVQRACFYLGLIGLGVMLLVVLFGSHSGFISAFNRESANLFGSKGAYGATLAVAKKANGGTIVPNLGFSPF